MSNLDEKIESARIKMQQLLECRGIIDEDVIAASVEVDILLNEYHQKKSKTECK